MPSPVIAVRAVAASRATGQKVANYNKYTVPHDAAGHFQHEIKLNIYYKYLIIILTCRN